MIQVAMGHAAHALAALDGQELEVRVNPFVRNADQWQLVLHFYHERSQSENDCVDRADKIHQFAKGNGREADHARHH